LRLLKEEKQEYPKYGTPLLFELGDTSCSITMKVGQYYRSSILASRQLCHNSLLYRFKEVKIDYRKVLVKPCVGRCSAIWLLLANSMYIKKGKIAPFFLLNDSELGVLKVYTSKKAQLSIDGKAIGSTSRSFEVKLPTGYYDLSLNIVSPRKLIISKRMLISKGVNHWLAE
jgi:hypothetical protein